MKQDRQKHDVVRYQTLSKCQRAERIHPRKMTEEESLRLSVRRLLYPVQVKYQIGHSSKYPRDRFLRE